MGLKHVCKLTNSGDIGGSVDPVDSTCHLLFRNSTLDRSPVVVTSFIHPACLCHPNHPDNPDHPDHLDYLDPLNHLCHLVHLDHPAPKKLLGTIICQNIVQNDNLSKKVVGNNNLQ